jgi:hypothetical protein
MDPDPFSSHASLTNLSIPPLLKRHQTLTEIRPTTRFYITSDALYAVSTLLKWNFAECLGPSDDLKELAILRKLLLDKTEHVMVRIEAARSLRI